MRLSPIIKGSNTLFRPVRFILIIPNPSLSFRALIKFPWLPMGGALLKTKSAHNIIGFEINPFPAVIIKFISTGCRYWLTNLWTTTFQTTMLWGCCSSSPLGGELSNSSVCPLGEQFWMMEVNLSTQGRRTIGMKWDSWVDDHCPPNSKYNWL